MRQANEQKTVVGLGEILWDLLPEGKQLGGAPANFAYHAQALGARASIVSRIGQDADGQEITDLLERRGLCRDHLQRDPDHPTGTVSIELDSQGKASYTIHEDVAWDHLQLNAALEALAARTDAVCFGSLAQRSEPSRRAIQDFLRHTPESAWRVFDINLRQHYYDEAVVRKSLALANVLKLNDEELPVVADMLGMGGDGRAQMSELIERFDLRLVALTLGADGCVLQSPAERVERPGVSPERLVDTVGAGDSFTAAVVTGLMAGRRLGETAERANRLAAFVCSRQGAMPDMTGWE